MKLEQERDREEIEVGKERWRGYFERGAEVIFEGMSVRIRMVERHRVPSASALCKNMNKIKTQ